VETDDGFAFELRDDRGRYRVVLDDDGRTGYAYLYEGSRIVGDVWLYNRGEAPGSPPWERPGAGPQDAPFANPRDCVDATTPRPEIEPDGGNLNSEWYWDGDSLRHVYLVIGDAIWARLAPGALPGWSRLAVSENPVARPLAEHGVGDA
jgi:hypothetical protein